MPGARVGVGPGLRELPRTPCMRSSQNSTSTTFVNKPTMQLAPHLNLYYVTKITHLDDVLRPLRDVGCPHKLRGGPITPPQEREVAHYEAHDYVGWGSGGHGGNDVGHGHAGIRG
jgi:hypothetical protein